MLGDYWGLVVLPPHEMAVSGDELGHAAAAYKNILKRWPGSLSALIGLGNLAYGRGESPKAVSFLEEATHHHPLAAAKKKKAACRSAEWALRLVAPDSQAAYRESLKGVI